jgi:hypothetical protein
MKLIKLFFNLLLILIFIACSKDTKKIKGEKNEIIRINQEIIENFDNKDLNKVIIDYLYEKDNDFFWLKAIYNDSSGKEIKTIEHEFDENRMPIKEIVKENNKIISSSDTKFDNITKELLLKETYIGERVENKKKITEKYNYDKNGYLISKEVTRYSNDVNYRNIDGTNIELYELQRMFPSSHNVPKGNYTTYWFIENSKKYLTKEDATKNNSNMKLGDLIYFEKTNFNEEGLPVSYQGNNPDCGDKIPMEWYNDDKDVDDTTILSITGYGDEGLSTTTRGNNEYRFEYDDNLLISKIEKYKYNPSTGAFDQFYELKSFDWIDPKLVSKHNWMEVSTRHEKRCPVSKTFEINERKVDKFDNGVKIISESKAVYHIDQVPDEPKLILNKRITQHYQIIEEKL